MAIARFWPWVDQDVHGAAPGDGNVNANADENAKEICKQRAAVSKHARDFDAWAEIQTMQHVVRLTWRM